jgi:hypothetical protein
MSDNVLFSKPDLFGAERILVVQPHYDDNDIQIGGILAKLADNGTELIYLTVTDDLVGVIAAIPNLKYYGGGNSNSSPSIMNANKDSQLSNTM